MLEDEKKKILKEQLGYLYQLNEINIRNRFAIKNWCIVVWLGLIVALLKFFEEPSAKENYPLLPLIVFLPVILFWFTEAVYGGQTVLYRKQIVDFEKKINTEPLTKNETKDLFIRSQYEDNFEGKPKMKIYSLIDSFFRGGTLTFFYLLMLATSFLFLIFFFPNFSINLSILCINFHISIWWLFVVAIIIIYLGYSFADKFLKSRIKLKE